MTEMMVSVVLDQLATLLVKIGTKVIMVENIKKLETTLKTIQDVLHDAEKKQVQNEGVKLWLESLKEVVYEIEDAVDKWNTKFLRSQIRTQSKDKEVYSYLFHLLNYFVDFEKSILASEFKRLREKLDFIDRDKNKYGLASGMPTEVAQAPPRQTTSSLVNVSEIIGRDVERDIIVSKLLSESSHNDQVGVPIISIVGMGGLGKTALAQLVSSDENVVKHFEKILWVCVSEPFDRIRVAKAIIEAIEEMVPTDHEWDALHCHLSKAVKNKRFMLVLNNDWIEDDNNWSPFKLSLDGGAPGSRILVTTRKEGVAFMMNSTYKHHLGRLTDENSWSLFRSAAHTSMEDKDYEMFEEIGKAITKKCKGVPLFIKTVGSLLRFKRNIQDWQEVLESETWKLQEFVKEPALLLSYYDLPSSWKPCFTYCAIFPKDYILEKDELIKLWMAHGFLYSTEKRELKKVGEEYFDGVVSRSLFQDVKTDEDGNVRSCKMHDLVHDLVQFLTKNETLIVERNDIIVNSSKLRHLNARNLDDIRATLSSIHKTSLRSLNLDDIRATLSSIHKTSLRSLNLKFQGLDGKIFRLWTCLRSLDLSNLNHLYELPNEIGRLIGLRYLDLSRTWVEELPNSLSNLCNLQTLKLNGCQFLCELPASMGNMISLRHLEIDKTESLRSLPEGIERLTSLRSLSKFIVSEGRNLGDLKGLNLIQGSIEISGLWRVKSAYEAKEVHFANKPGIHALTLDFGSEVDINEYKERMERVLEGLQPHPNLEELKINEYRGSKLPSWMMSDLAPMFSKLRTLELTHLTQGTTLTSLGRLPFLEVLKLHKMKFVKRLGLDFLGISDIEEEDDATTEGICREKLLVFPKLIQLYIIGMNELEEWVLPFERSDTLQIMPRLRILEICWAPKLKVLPALGRLESLEELTIRELHSLKRIGPEFFGISDDDVVMKGTSGESVPIIVFPKLKKLEFWVISELEEWEILMPSWREDVSFIMPCLKELLLNNCEKLKVVPYNIFSYQTVEEKIVDLNQRTLPNQIIRRRDVGESTGKMAMFRRLFNQKPPDRLLEISERVYVFDSCFSTDILEEGESKSYMDGIVAQLQDYFPDSSFRVFNFREGERRSEISDLLFEHNITVMDYPTQYERCPVLPLEMINHFLKSSEDWLLLEGQQNVLLMHCERGGWPMLAFMLAGFLLYRKQFTEELKTLEMVYKQAPIELLHLLSPLNPKPSQLRYLQYISRRNLDSDWAPSDTPLSLDILILRFLPLINGERSCMPIVRVYGQDPSAVGSRSSKILFSTPKTKKHVRRYTKAEHTSMQKIDISCLVQGDVVLECIHFDDDLVHEEMMFRIMFNTTLIQSNVLMLGREEIDVLWDYKVQLPKEFKAEVLFSDFNAINEDEDQTGEEFFEVEEIFNNGKRDPDIQVKTQNKSKNLGELAGVSTVFRFEDLKMATKNFQDKLGSGGSGSVFRGVLKDGTLVAVKRVQHVKLGEQMLERIYAAEVSALANVKHVHLITLRGYCIHMMEMGRYFLIVYDLLPNGSLGDWIFSRTGSPTDRCLPWKSRYRIAVDVAEVLAYLHHDCSPQILHLDVKPDNILLDNNLRGVLSDFGLSRLMQNDVGPVFSTIRGTRGYIDPRWEDYGISAKCDIYSYGKVLLDIFFGKCYVCLNQEGIDISEGGNSEREQRIFHAFMWKRLRQCKIMDLIDKRLVESEGVDEREAICLVYAALSCLQDYPELRPHDMREVIDILNQKSNELSPYLRLLELGSTT